MIIARLRIAISYWSFCTRPLWDNAGSRWRWYTPDSRRTLRVLDSPFNSLRLHQYTVSTALFALLQLERGWTFPASHTNLPGPVVGWTPLAYWGSARWAFRCAGMKSPSGRYPQLPFHPNKKGQTSASPATPTSTYCTFFFLYFPFQRTSCTSYTGCDIPN
jgi:hypothetical protein